MEKRIFDRENRFVDYACRMIDVIESLQTTRAGNYIAGQLIKSCISPAFNYGEVQGSESRNDFIHKMGVVLKELKRMPYSIKNYKKKRDDKPIKKLDKIYQETEELIAITGKSISTAQKNKNRSGKTEH